MLCGLNAGAQIITATVTVTATATNGMTFSLNGVVRTWTNTVTAANTQLLTSSNIISTASNLFSAYVIVPASSIIITKTASNTINFQSFSGTAATVAFGGSWGTVSYSTNTVTNTTVVRVPKTAAGNYEQTNVESGLIDYLNDNKMGTNIIKVTAPAFVNFVSTATVSKGVKNLASNVITVTVSGLALTFTPTIALGYIGGTNVDLTIGSQVNQDTITTNGATFRFDALTDSTNYSFNYFFQ